MNKRKAILGIAIFLAVGLFGTLIFRSTQASNTQVAVICTKLKDCIDTNNSNTIAQVYCAQKGYVQGLTKDTGVCVNKRKYGKVSPSSLDCISGYLGENGKCIVKPSCDPNAAINSPKKDWDGDKTINLFDGCPCIPASEKTGGCPLNK